MLTRNYARGFAAWLTRGSSESIDYGNFINHLGNPIKHSDYTQYVSNYYYLFTATQTPTVSQVVAGQYAGPQGFVFGDGDAPESFDDFKMAGNHFTTFTYTCSKTVTVEEDCITSTHLFTLTNTGTEAFTIREVGQFNYPGSAKDKSCLLERTVLKSPVTIPAGGIGQVTYTMKFPLTV